MVIDHKQEYQRSEAVRVDDDLIGDQRQRAREARRCHEFHEKYGDIGTAVLDILIRYDPGPVAKVGAPGVQYVIEAGRICQRLPAARSPKDVTRIVYEVMAEKFSEKIANRESRYDRIGEEILEVWTRSDQGK